MSLGTDWDISEMPLFTTSAVTKPLSISLFHLFKKVYYLNQLIILESEKPQDQTSFYKK